MALAEECGATKLDCEFGTFVSECSTIAESEEEEWEQFPVDEETSEAEETLSVCSTRSSGSSRSSGSAGSSFHQRSVVDRQSLASLATKTAKQCDLCKQAHTGFGSRCSECRSSGSRGSIFCCPVCHTCSRGFRTGKCEHCGGAVHRPQQESRTVNGTQEQVSKPPKVRSSLLEVPQRRSTRRGSNGNATASFGAFRRYSSSPSASQDKEVVLEIPPRRSRSDIPSMTMTAGSYRRATSPIPPSMIMAAGTRKSTSSSASTQSRSSIPSSLIMGAGLFYRK